MTINEKKGIIDLVNKLNRTKKAGLISGTLLLTLGTLHTSGAVLAMVDPAVVTGLAKTAVDITQSNPFVGIIFIVGIVFGLLLWQLFKVLIAQAKELAKLNINLERLVDNMNQRPCIFKRQEDKPQNDKPL